MIADPGIGIVFQGDRGHCAEGRLPASAIAAAEADEEVRGVLQIATFECGFREVDAIDYVFAAYGIGKFLEARGDLIEQHPFTGWRNDPSILAAFEVDIDPVEADGVGHAAGPIDMGEERGVTRIGGIVESQEALDRKSTRL